MKIHSKYLGTNDVLNILFFPYFLFHSLLTCMNIQNACVSLYTYILYYYYIMRVILFECDVRLKNL